jgi:hypothetical protein
MAKPTLKQLFGSASFILTDPAAIPSSISAASPALVIPLSSLAEGLLNAPESMEDGEKVAVALFNIMTAWYRADSTEDPIIEASEVRESSVTRRSQKMRAYAYEFTAHKPLPASPTIDPDLIDIL